MAALKALQHRHRAQLIQFIFVFRSCRCNTDPMSVARILTSLSISLGTAREKPSHKRCISCGIVARLPPLYLPLSAEIPLSHLLRSVGCLRKPCTWRNSPDTSVDMLNVPLKTDSDLPDSFHSTVSTLLHLEGKLCDRAKSTWILFTHPYML